MRFYFDIQDDFYIASDDAGGDFPSVEAARREAVTVATSIARDLFMANGSQVTVTVRDDVKPLWQMTVTLTRKDCA
jgi:hypothetical protein